LTPIDKYRNLGIEFDSDPCFNKSTICRSSFRHIRQLRQVRSFLDTKFAIIFASAFVSSKLDYCNSLFITFHQNLEIGFNSFKILSLELSCHLSSGKITLFLLSEIYTGCPFFIASLSNSLRSLSKPCTTNSPPTSMIFSLHTVLLAHFGHLINTCYSSPASVLPRVEDLINFCAYCLELTSSFPSFLYFLHIISLWS
jgi:hypothetical protein